MNWEPPELSIGLVVWICHNNINVADESCESVNNVNTGFALKSISRQPLLPITTLWNTSQMTIETHLASEWRNAGVTKGLGLSSAVKLFNLTWHQF